MRSRLMRAGAALLTLCVTTLYAGTLSFKGECERARALFLPGEPIVFTIRLMEDSQPVAGKKLQWIRTGDDQKTESSNAVSSVTRPLTVTTTLGQPGFVRLQVRVLGDDGKPVKDARGQDVAFDGGAAVAPERLESQPEPGDFDAFWARQKAKLAAVPLKADLKEVAWKNPAFKVFDVKVDCAGGKPVSGYLVRPAAAAPKSLQAHVGFMGYSVSSPNPDPQAGKITFTINAHGIENGREAAYYQGLRDGELKGYAFNARENADSETAYFNGMILRVMRALEFIKAQPEWNGRDLIVAGGSQGGFQALHAAALDSAVTQCSVSKPWCCDLGGLKAGRLGGWRPAYTDALAYYDPVNQAKRITCRTTIVAGLGDYTCPPSGIAVLYNNLKAPKTVEYVQGGTHGYNPPGAQTFTLESR